MGTTRKATTMTQQDRLGDFRYVRDGVAIRHDRRVDAAPARVWEALTDPVVLGRWLGQVTVADRDVTVRLGGDAPAASGRVTYCDPQQMLEVDLHWPEEPPARLVSEIAELGPDRAVVVLEYRGLPDAVAAERAAEWHRRMDALAAVLVGGEPAAGGAGPELVAAYEVALAELRSSG
ncbi:MAG TPA: SRPBCC domain-containing protein [Mycobacteriales bacterium]|jgi:uncharacterized protein YndB with AHSA1/START domain|nr:SRPBCC domain-containing protein [Mycobacteriales bacterium]